MATINFDFYKGYDQYIDKEEEILLNYYKGLDEIKDPQDNLFFLTTEERENILSWYPFNNKTVLEIGSGCGCITGALTKCCKKVVSVEQSKRRAQITFERHKDKKNLEVYCGNITDIPFDEQFDYIILIGVLEYSKSFFTQEPQDLFFLNLLRNHLKPEGILLLAIENRYGMKYFAGANEDHVCKPYISITGYDDEYVTTYGKNELINILNKSGFTKCNFFYPFPDYKLPSIIYSDSKLPDYYESLSLPIYTYGNNVNFSIQKAFANIAQFDQIDFFSNSFLVEAGTENSAFTDIVYAKFQTNRTKYFQTISIQEKNNIFYKIPNNFSAVEHLNNYKRIHSKLNDIGLHIPSVHKCFSTYKWQVEFIDGISICKYIDLIGDNFGQDGMLVELNNLVNYFYSMSNYSFFEKPILEELKNIYKDETYILKYGLLDLNSSNMLFDINRGYCVIDQEWESKAQIPTDYSILNSIGHLYTNCINLKKFFTLEQLLNNFGLDNKKISVLNKIADKFFLSEYSILDKNKKVIFENLSKYNLNSFNEMDKKNVENLNKEYTNILQAYESLVSFSTKTNYQLKDLSENYNRVLKELESAQIQLNKKNNELTDLVQNYNRVVSQLSILEKQNIEQNQQLSELSENYCRVTKLIDKLEK